MFHRVMKYLRINYVATHNKKKKKTILIVDLEIIRKEAIL